MKWFREHADSMAVISAIIVAMIWMNGKLNDIQREMDHRFANVEKDMAVIKTVLVMKEILPRELATQEQP